MDTASGSKTSSGSRVVYYQSTPASRVVYYQSGTAPAQSEQNRGTQPQAALTTDPAKRLETQRLPSTPADPVGGRKRSSSSIEDSPAGCVCERKNKAVGCGNCGYFKNGLTIRKICPVHPNVKYIMNLEKCPACRSGELEEAE